jgi:hypothetical protein
VTFANAFIAPLRGLAAVVADAIADRVHAPADARARASGLVVERLSGGRRRISDPRVPAFLENRRRRLIRDGLDPIDRALLDPATVELLAATARRMAAEQRPARQVRRPPRSTNTQRYQQMQPSTPQQQRTPTRRQPEPHTRQHQDPKTTKRHATEIH